MLPVLMLIAAAFLMLPESWTWGARSRTLSMLQPVLDVFDSSKKAAPRAALIKQEYIGDQAAVETRASVPCIDPAEVDRLRAEIVRLRDYIRYQQQIMQAGNVSTGEDPRKTNPPGVVAKVLTREIFYQEPILALNRGSNQGVKPGAGVLFRGAVVGRVVNCAGDASCMALLTHPGVRIAARLTECRLEGVLQGGEPGGICKIKIVAREVPVRVGENVVTSGLDGNFPAGCWIGVATKVQKKSEMEWEVFVKPACDASSVEAVYVLASEPLEIPWPAQDPKKRK